MTTAESAEFREFLGFVGKEGYASPKAPIAQLEDGSHDLVLEDNGFRFHDNWFGGEPYGGREIISKNGKPFWIAIYYGAFDKDAEAGTKALREALLEPDPQLPVRGPGSFTASNGYSYNYEWHGSLDRFHSIETIRNDNGDAVYKAYINGGLIDR